MTLLNRWLTHLICTCELGQKSHAWHQAKHLAEIHPHELSCLPDLLVSAMRSQSSNANVTDTKDGER